MTNPAENPIGLRDLPLSHYLIRGKRSNAATHYEELKQLRREQATVVPLPSGPFRLFTSDDADRQGLVRTLSQGIEVLRVEPGAGQTIGTIVGYVDGGRTYVVLAHDPDPIAVAEWELLEVYRGRQPARALARLSGKWSVASPQKSGMTEGNAIAAFDELVEIQSAYEDWSKEPWRPPVVSVPFFVIHLGSKVERTHHLDLLLNDLGLSRAELFVAEHPRGAASQASYGILRLIVPRHQMQLELHRRELPDSGPNEWVLVQVSDCLRDAVAIASIHTRWKMFTPSVRLEMRSLSTEQTWIDRLKDCESGYQLWSERKWPVRKIVGGSFFIRVAGRAQADLRSEGLAPDELCLAMTRGLQLLTVSGSDASEVIAMPEGVDYRIRLRPHRPLKGASDWTLKSVKLAQSSEPAFARVLADWHEGRRGQPASTGDAAALLRNLKVLQNRREERTELIQRTDDLASGATPELDERISTWRRVCELERDLLQVGLAKLERVGDDYRLVPEEVETLDEWIDGVMSINREGVDWTRYSLELRRGDQYARLIIRGHGSALPDHERFLTVACDNPHGRALADSLNNGVGPLNSGDEKVQLFLPNTQLQLIDSALNILDPRQQTRPQKRGVAGGDLSPDDQSLGALRSILFGANGLESRRQEWPALPVPPVAQLSPAQEEAVRAAIFGPDMTLIQGPPGTGKTTVILEILRQLMRLHGRSPQFKVLLVAPTHVAVDNVLERLVAPRRGGNLLTELGVSPYRVGSTRKIAPHLRGFTPDCINTEYRHRLEKEVAAAVHLAKMQATLDREMIDITAEGAKQCRAAWEHALESGELPEDGWLPSWPPELDAQWRTRVATQRGRVQAWRHWRTRGTRPEQRAELLRRWLDFLQKSPRFFSELLVANANLVCATTVGCATHRELRSTCYDYVIVDEAGKEEARRLLVPLIRGERWVLVGDHQQLPPYADDSLKKKLIGEGLDHRIVSRSLFEELQAPFEKRGCYVFLDRQGRMHPDICSFVSERFYGGRLRDFPHTIGHAIPRPAFLPEDPKLLVLDTKRLPQRHETRRGMGYVNLQEQNIVLHLLRAFADLDAWRDPLAQNRLTDIPSVGVIAPYRLQVEELSRRVRQDEILNRLLREELLYIGTVDSFQGQERDLMLFTCTRSNPRGRLGFVDNRQRLNVALSRARCRLIVILDGESVRQSQIHDDAAEAEAETRDHLHALLKFAETHNGVYEVPLDWRQRWRG